MKHLTFPKHQLYHKLFLYRIFPYTAYESNTVFVIRSRECLVTLIVLASAYETAMKGLIHVSVLVCLCTLALAGHSCRDDCNYGDTLGGVDLSHLKG